MKWRRLNYILHRDIGYLCIGLTLIYAVSGIVVNHISHSFNPSYTIEHSETTIEPVSKETKPDMALVDSILQQLGEKGAFKNVALLAPGKLRIFVEGNTIDVNLSNGEVKQEKVARRPILFKVNYLHLNKAKGIWTWIADGYAVLLVVLTITGFLMIRKNSRVRGLVLTGLGFVVPLVFLFFSI